jgi:hypothetical protein
LFVHSVAVAASAVLLVFGHCIGVAVARIRCSGSSVVLSGHRRLLLLLLLLVHKVTWEDALIAVDLTIPPVACAINTRTRENSARGERGKRVRNTVPHLLVDQKHHTQLLGEDLDPIANVDVQIASLHGLKVVEGHAVPEISI